MSQIIKIDGGILEGGGQILRIATALSSLLNKPIEISNIRASRRKPGLAAQHLKGLQLATEICSAKLTGAHIGSTSIKFIPGQIKSSHFKVDVGTAGSISLLLQVSLPILMFADGESSLELVGGTNADMAPQIDYMINIFQPVASKFGMVFHCDIVKRGFFPKGGGIVRVSTSPVNEKLIPVEMVERGQITKIVGCGFIAGKLPDKAMCDMKSTAENLLIKKNLNSSVSVVREPESRADGTGCGIILKAITGTDCILAGTGLGRRGVTSNQIAEDAVISLLDQIEKDDRCVDEYLQDQLIILMALADGKSRIRTEPLTLHTQTAMKIAEVMIGKEIFRVVDDRGFGNIIECDGIGWSFNIKGLS